MKIVCRILILFLFSFEAKGVETFLAGEKIKKILLPLNSQAGFSLRDLSGKEIFEWHGLNSYPPASVSKMVSSACAMRTLTPQFQFETIFGHTGVIQNGVLTGDLVLVGSGDPSFVVEDLKEALERLFVVHGIHSIVGNIVFDASFLGTKTLPLSDEFDGDHGRAFTADLTAMPFDFNSFALWVVPQNGEVRIQILPKDSLNLKIVNQVKITRSGGTEVVADYRPDDGKVVVSGKMVEGSEAKQIRRSLPDPYASLSQTMLRIWRELGGEWKSPLFRVETKPFSFQRIDSVLSRAISQQFLAINKLSTNFGAEMILLAAGAQEFGRPTNFEKSRLVLQNCLKTFDISPVQITLENASGLSHTSTMQPSGLTLFLAKLSKVDFWAEYLSTLSTIGRDGTYRARLQEIAGRARVKSGSLKGVNTLAGYVFPLNKEAKAFSLFFKCPNCDLPKLHKMEDDILKILAES
ncbi:MAG: D-alanyl-D-alanine carboxypeptidase/D-alanyl-D-alanine-endopeptidase [Bacteriovoracaceae bacterium]|nr:D-alanyl-D-alanine carboxypeptidase/D-alanyl-D-alanine-endopeptidase [Bacteriovoracaceae bacterium]